MKHWWLLKREPLGGGSDWLCTLFTRHSGLVKVVCRDAQLPEIHQPCRGEWPASGDLPKLKTCEADPALELSGEALVCALYMDELLTTILPLNDPSNELFDLYSTILSNLSNNERIDIWLRMFEQCLLSHCGQGIHWTQTTHGAPVIAGTRYLFRAGEGLIEDPDGWNGEILLAIAEGEFRQQGALAVARQVLRIAIDCAVSRPLISRELLIHRS
ncbi:DNA repair protein RecO [Thalassolituus sp.]|uniref:DNA repair protein RecO n=1 Tax=Thalassolituus sp. TaxID=2030822 RepID=UPI002620E356|nr:DNA repair protein RecO C-terminal domain-containing protein [Thalassolituus sp.]MEC9409024.1 DNA repair protein RecO C-terminal domain-containing protein [Pseudomonadota bacterium]MEE3160587.1 DNA repair protein RecO C-terminal domain-containing protein [Pseudomonadota bacterium]